MLGQGNANAKSMYLYSNLMNFLVHPYGLVMFRMYGAGAEAAETFYSEPESEQR